MQKEEPGYVYYNMNETWPRTTQPENMSIRLRKHQLTCISAMMQMENDGHVLVDNAKNNLEFKYLVKNKLREENVDKMLECTYMIESNTGILGDGVGSGKSYMIIGLIEHKLVPRLHDRLIYGTDNISIKMLVNPDLKYEKTNLIVVPHNLALQWQEFFDKSGTKLKYVCFNKENDFDQYFVKSYVYGKDMKFGTGITHRKITTKAELLIAKKALNHVDTKISMPDTSNMNPYQKQAALCTYRYQQRANTADIYEKITGNQSVINECTKKYDVIILNVNRYKSFNAIFKNKKWARVIIDEMDTAKVPSIFNEYGNFNWFITATPSSIFNHGCARYVNSIFGNTRNCIRYITVKNSDLYISTCLKLPEPLVYIFETRLNAIVKAMQNFIPADVLALINSGNMKDALVKLNCNVETKDNVAEILSKNIKAEMHNLNAKLKYETKLINPDQDEKERKLKKIRDDISRCKTKLETIAERLDSIKDECCFICTENFKNPVITNCCKTVFCLQCLVTSLKSNRSCPQCRYEMNSNKDYHVIDDSIIKSSTDTKIEKDDKNIKYVKDLYKIDCLKLILDAIATNPDPRILIFSDYPETFSVIKSTLDKSKLVHSLVSGTPSHISKTICEFNDAKINVLLLDSKHYGSGLNLQSANYVLLYHRMTPELEEQVIGRAHRQGRVGSVKIIYLIDNNERKTCDVAKDIFNVADSKEINQIFNLNKNSETMIKSKNVRSSTSRKSSRTSTTAAKSTKTTRTTRTSTTAPKSKTTKSSTTASRKKRTN